MNFNDNYRIYNRMLITTSAPHQSSVITKETLKKTSGAWLLRYTTEFDCGYETQWWYLIKDTKSEIASLKKKHRSMIKISLNNCCVKMINPVDHATGMYNIYNNAFLRYESSNRPTNEEKYLADCKDFEFDNNIDVFGVFLRDGNILVGYSVNYVYEDYVSYSSVKLDPRYLSFGISHALFYEMNTYYLNIQNKKYVCDGERSIRHKTNIQEYLVKYFGFRKAYCKLHVIYKPAVGFAVSCLYPIRNIFNRLNKISIFNNIYSLLLLEDIRRLFNSDSRI